MGEVSITPDIFAQLMEDIFSRYERDLETAHIEADDLICQVMRERGYTAGIEIFERAPKWYA